MGRTEGVSHERRPAGGRHLRNLSQFMAHGAGLSYNRVEDRDTVNVPLHPSLHRGARLHLLHGTERHKELERLMKISGIKMSVDKVLNMAKTVTTISVYMSKN